MSAATVTRVSAPSGNRDADRFHPHCERCGWHGAYYVNRAAYARSLAERDARNHRCAVQS